MTPALIGLLGVIAGGLLGGVVSYRVERRRRRDQASVAARMITFELDAATRRLEAAARSDPPTFPATIRVQQWNDRGGTLIGFLERSRVVETKPPAPPEGEEHEEEQQEGAERDQPGSRKVRVGLADNLVRAYAIIDSYNADTLTEADKGALGAPETLERNAERLEKVQKQLQRWIDRRRTPRQKLALGSSVFAVAAAVALGVAALVVLRPYATSETVAAAIAAGLNGRQAVECLDEPGAVWDCTILPVSGSSCGTTAASFRLKATPQRASA